VSTETAFHIAILLDLRRISSRYMRLVAVVF
jgi:hypothetical protein